MSLVPDSGLPVCKGERGSFNGELTATLPDSSALLELYCDRLRLVYLGELFKFRFYVADRVYSCLISIEYYFFRTESSFPYQLKAGFGFNHTVKYDRNFLLF